MSDREWLQAAIAPASAYGALAFQALRPFRPGEETAAEARADYIFQIAQRVEETRLEAARAEFRGVPDAQGAIARASLGDTLSDASFLELQRVCDAVIRVDALFANAEVEACATDAIRNLARELEPGRSGKFGFYLVDEFAPALAQARRAAAIAQSEFEGFRARAVAKAAEALGRDDSPSGEFIVMRADFNGALPPGLRIVREAPTYRLCEIEFNEATLAALALRDDAARAVADAEEAARQALSGLVRANAEALGASLLAYGELDVLVAAARFTQRYACSVAHVAKESMLAFKSGRYLPLLDALEREGRAFQPLDLVLDGIAILTGPNMGGKTVALHTCAFIALSVAYGLPVAAANAHVALFDDVAWLGIGGDESAIENGNFLSSFANEVVALREILARTAQRRLVLIDEFARTTTPSEGRALLLALIARLRALGACALVATHLSGIAEASGATHLAVRGLRAIPVPGSVRDVRAALAALATTMDYSIIEVHGVRDQHSDAIALAALLGLDPAFIDAAKAALQPGRTTLR